MARRHQHVHIGEGLENSTLDKAADALCLEVVLSGHLQAGFQPGDLRPVHHQVDYVAAGDQRLEDGPLFSRQITRSAGP